MTDLAEGLRYLASLLVISGFLGLFGMMRGGIKGMKKSATKSWQKNLTEVISAFFGILAFAAAILLFNIRA